MGRSGYGTCVFINAPFDEQYKPLFEAAVFAVYDCGFYPRCSLEHDDGSQVRLEKLLKTIAGCGCGIHDLSRTELDKAHRLPRFNMPFELGLFMGAKAFGSGRQKRKTCLILDRERYRYQKFISDIAGQDPREHRNRADLLIGKVRNFLHSLSSDVRIPGGEMIGRRFSRFLVDLPASCARVSLERRNLTYKDYCTAVTEWLHLNPWPNKPERKKKA
jgi:hypothetical protein